MTNGGVRTVEVHPPSRGREALAIALLAALVALCALSSIWIRGAPLPPADGVARRVEGQAAFQELPGPEQRMVRELLEGFSEAMRLRAQTREWPTPGKLAADQVPPFAENVLDERGYRWTLKQVRLVVNYLGTAAAQGGPDFLLMIKEPGGAAFPQAPEPEDEEHQRLPDGKMLHVTYWMRPAGPAPEAIVASPETEGWTQIRVVAKGTLP